MSSTDNTKEPTWQDKVIASLAQFDWQFIGNGKVFAVRGSGFPRSTEPGREPFYYVMEFLQSDGSVLRLCICKSFRFRAACPHVEKVANRG